MGRVEKTVFISYRRTNAAWATAVYQNLTHHGYDVFFDFTGIGSGDFERVILENIKARAHFLILLTPSALERINNPGDWLRREIEYAMQQQRNIVPLFFEGFDFSAPTIKTQLTGTLMELHHYNGLGVPAEYFDAAMDKLRTRHLDVPLDAVLHPASVQAVEAAITQQSAVKGAPSVEVRELTAGEWFEKGFTAVDLDEKVRDYDKAIRLKPDYALAYSSRGNARQAKGDLDGALRDYDEAIRLAPDYAVAYNNRGKARKAKGDLEGALKDYNETIRLQPDYANAYNRRGNARQAKGDLEGALKDYNEAIRLQPDYAKAYYNRGLARQAKFDFDGALKDYGQTIRLYSDYAKAYYNRGALLEHMGDYQAAAADFQRYLDLGAGRRDGDQTEVEARIRRLMLR